MHIIESRTTATMFKTFGLCKLGHIFQFDHFLSTTQSCNFHEMLKYVKFKKMLELKLIILHKFCEYTQIVYYIYYKYIM
jgi:hypothetical protein